MMRTRSISLVAVGIIMVVAVAVSYLVARPSIFVQKQSLPVFMGQEVIIHKSAELVKTVPMVAAVTTVSAPLPQPKVAVPLPVFPPKVAYSVLPNYPVSVLAQGLGGTTVLSIYIGADGSSEKVEVKSSSGISELDQSAVAAVSQWKFEPAAQGGRAIASWFEVPVRFVIN